jgi:ribosome-binding factor A
VFYTVLGTEEERISSGAALTSATGMLRSEVGRQLSTRLVPTLEFIPDALPENADHIGALLREAQQRDADVAKLASSASHAGDADPYRAEDEPE